MKLACKPSWVRNEPWLQVGSLIFTITYGPEVVSAGPFQDSAFIFLESPQQDSFPMNNMGWWLRCAFTLRQFLKSMFPIATGTWFNTKNMVASRRNKGTNHQQLRNPSLLGGFNPPIDTTQLGPHPIFRNGKPSISKATVMRQVNLQFVPDMGALKKTISTGRSSALV